jgi:ABC-2 type transport system ATP-binding protein
MSPMSSPAVIEADAVEKSFGATQALRSVSFDVGSGLTGLLGSNGAGKTTLIKLLLGLHRRDGGSLRVLGIDPADAGPDLRLRLGYAPEHHNLPPDMHAADFVRHIAQLHGIPRRVSTERASDALWQVGLGEERFRPIGTMSTGQRQRVKLAQAIAHDPALVMLDEPTDGLDPVQRDEMLQLIRRIGTEFGIDMLLSSHHLDEVERVCDDVVILAGGVVSRSGSISDLRGAAVGLVIEVDERSDELAGRLEAAGLSVERNGSRLFVDGDRAARVVCDAVAELGVGLRRLEPRTVSLEDVFLEADS